MRCVVRTPESAHFDGEVTVAVLPATDGEIGILPKHAAMVCALGTGACRLTTDEGVLKFALSGGFSRVRDNVITVLTTRCETGSKISAEEAKKALEEAKGDDIPWARARLKAAGK